LAIANSLVNDGSERLTEAAPRPEAVGHRVSKHDRRDRREREGLAFAILGLLLALTWYVSQQDWFTAGDDVGYWIGVVGGSMLLLLLIYPLRKHVRALQGVGSMKTWLWGHMVLGIGGPLLVLLHCKFTSGSLNAAAALYSMLIVAGSGIIGRFLYTRVNRGLVVERRQLELEHGQFTSARAMLKLLPGIREGLQQFEVAALRASDRAGAHWLRLVFVLPVQSWVSRIRQQRQARAALHEISQQQGWDRAAFSRRHSRLKREIAHYYMCVMRVALFAAWERLFALWHVAHVPFVVLLLGAGVIHVVAVHAY
jgi:hypothetical protein